MVEEYLRKFELNNTVLEDFDSLMEKHLDQIEELVVSEIDPKSKLLNIVGLCINVRTLIIEGDQRTNVNAIIANICKPELLQNLILDNVKIPSNFSFKKLTNLRMVSLNNIRFCSVKNCLDEIVNPEKIEALNFDKVDFAKNSLEIVSKFKNLKYLNVTKALNCVLNNLEFLEEMHNLEKVNIEDNILSFREINALLKGKFHKEITAELKSENNNVVTNSIEIKENGTISITVNGEDLDALIENINLYKVNNILIIDNGNCNLTNYIHILKQVKGKIAIAIKDVSCIDVKEAKELKEKLKIEYINIIDFDEALAYEKNSYCYKIDTYIKIRKAIDDILQNIDLEADELYKFLAIYNILGTDIMYDNILEKQVQSSNLENGLLEKKCIDSGFAEILKNCLAVLGIDSKIIRGSYAGIAEEHVWNQVKIMDKWYNVDLGLDSKKMSNSNKFKSKPTYCLLCDKDFSKTHIPKSSKTEYCSEIINPKIISRYFKSESTIVAYAKSIIEKIKKVLTYNKQVALPEGKNSKEVDKENNED
jgi:hypothetical protein